MSTCIIGNDGCIMPLSTLWREKDAIICLQPDILEQILIFTLYNNRLLDHSMDISHQTSFGIQLPQIVQFTSAIIQSQESIIS